jgi:preprotein translocase subunit SecF
MLTILKKLYEKKYKYLLIIPFTLLLTGIIILAYWNVTTGEFVSKDITLKGGLMVTVETDSKIDVRQAEEIVESELGVTAIVKELSSFGAGSNLGYIFEVEKVSNSDTVITAISKAVGHELEEGTYTIEETSATLSETFWRSTIKALALAFIFMACVVFFYFRKIVPSLAIILSALSDFTITLAAINIFDIKLSMAGVAALLMLIGYSVDSNILLSVRVLKHHEGTVFDRISNAVVTGITMSGTTLTALIVIYLLTPSIILKQITLILVIGLFVDFINTWIQNAGILRIWLEKKHGQD